MDNEGPAADAKEAAAKAEAQALESVTDLIVFTLKAGDFARFNEAKRLCGVAQSLMKARAQRAGDFQGEDAGERLGDQQQYMMRAVANAFQAQAGPAFTINATTGTTANTAAIITTANGLYNII